MKLFPLTVCLFLASSVDRIAQASDCFLVDPSGRKIEMDFCGVNNTRQPSAATYESETFEPPTPSSFEESEEFNQPIEEERRVTNAHWQEIKILVAQKDEKNPVYYDDIEEIMKFPGELIGSNADGSQKYEWRDTKNPEIKIIGVFLNDELRHLSGTVY